MSKLVEKLQRISEGSSQPIGFRAATSERGQRMLLIAFPQGDPAKVVEAAPVDALLVPIEASSSAHQIATAIGNVLWGAWFKTMSQENIKELEQAGCDFLIFETTMSAAAIRAKEIGKVLRVDPTLGDSSIRAIDKLPIDGVLINQGEPFLTVNQLIDCQRFADLMEKPLLVAAPSSLEPSNLDSLWEAGVDGVVVKLEQEASKEKLLELRKAIDSLPPAAKRGMRKTKALLPHPGVSIPAEEE